MTWMTCAEVAEKWPIALNHIGAHLFPADLQYSSAWQREREASQNNIVCVWVTPGLIWPTFTSARWWRSLIYGFIKEQSCRFQGYGFAQTTFLCAQSASQHRERKKSMLQLGFSLLDIFGTNGSNMIWPYCALLKTNKQKKKVTLFLLTFGVIIIMEICL